MDKLSFPLRQVLINQYEILKELSNDENQKKEYDFKIEILHDGYSRLYDDVFGQNRPENDEEMDYDRQDFVIKLLDMYNFFAGCYDSNKDSKEYEELLPLIKDVGFDSQGINSDLRSFADSLFSNGKYKQLYELKKKVFDPKDLYPERDLSYYKTKIEKYNEFLTNTSLDTIGVKEIKEILE